MMQVVLHRGGDLYSARGEWLTEQGVTSISGREFYRTLWREADTVAYSALQAQLAEARKKAK